MRRAGSALKLCCTKQNGEEPKPLPVCIAYWLFPVNQIFAGLRGALQAAGVRATVGQALVVEQQSEITLGCARGRGTGAESADVCERMAVLERSLRDHISNESGTAVVKTPLLAATGGDVGQNLTGRDYSSAGASAWAGSACSCACGSR